MEEKNAGDKPGTDAARPARAGHGPGRPPLRHVLMAYENFERIVAVVLSLLIAVIVLVALIELVRIVIYMLETETLNPLQQETFHLVFGMIMTLLIALEFKHSIIKVALRNESVVQVRTVILIALLALARKFVILDVHSSPAQIAALAASLLALGAVYGIVRKRDRRRKFGPPPPAGEQAPPLAPDTGWGKERDRVR
jgi:uncharacterized membrane protein (DUF373 family)